MSAGEFHGTAVAARRGGHALDRVITHIQDHLAKPLPLAGLAAIAGLSVWRFSTVFRLHLGLSPHRYIGVQRVRQGQVLLRQGMPPATVAGRGGLL